MNFFNKIYDNLKSIIKDSKAKQHNENLKLWSNPLHFIAFGFGLGALPVAPGTWGTLAGVLFYILIVNFHWFSYLLIILAATIFGVHLCSKVSIDLEVHDHSGIVWDEIVGYLLTMFLVPLNVYTIVLGFILFRIFDILKPWPISMVDSKVKGGLGIMLDDILAAIPAWFILQIIIRFIL